MMCTTHLRTLGLNNEVYDSPKTFKTEQVKCTTHQRTLGLNNEVYDSPKNFRTEQ